MPRLRMIAALAVLAVAILPPALIKKVCSMTPDAQGQYIIVDLRPGNYTVTFTLPGFDTIKRKGIELTTLLIANVRWRCTSAPWNV